MSTLLTRYAFLQETEWAGRSVYRVRDDQAGRELYLIREPLQGSTIACSHPALPLIQPLTAEGDVRWFTAEDVCGENLQSLRVKRLLTRDELRAALEAVVSALTHLSTLNPPLVPGTIEPDCIKRDETGRWKLDVPALAFTREAKLSPGHPAGLNQFGRLLYWLATGETLRHGTNQAPLQQGVTPMLYFMVMRCLSHAYNSLGYLQQDLDRLWEDPGFQMLIRDLGREVGVAPAGLPDHVVEAAAEPGPATPVPTQQAGAPPKTGPGVSPKLPAATPNRAWGSAPPPAHLRRTVEPEESQSPLARLRSRPADRQALLRPYLAVGAALLLVAVAGAAMLWPRSSPSMAPESSRSASPSATAQPPQQPKAAAPEPAIDPAEAALLLQSATHRDRSLPAEAPKSATAPARPSVLRPGSPPPPFPALQPGSHQSMDMAAGGSPTWISLNGRWIGYAYIYYSNGAKFISVDAVNDLFGRNLTWLGNGANSYAIFENGNRLITGDANAISTTRLWLKLTPEMQRWLGVQLQAVDDWGMHFKSLR